MNQLKFLFLFLMFVQFSFAKVIDTANLFSNGAISKTNQKIEKFKKQTKKDFVFETVKNTNHLPVSDFALKRAKENKVSGIYVLISQEDRKIEIKVSKKTNQSFDKSKRAKILKILSSNFKKRNFDKGLTSSVDYFYSSIGGKNLIAQKPQKAGFSWLTIGIIIVAILIVIRLVSSLLARRRQNYNGLQQQGNTYDNGHQQGYSGGRGSGIFGSLLAGVFGAVAGNWLYDKFLGSSGGLFANDNSNNSDLNDNSNNSDLNDNSNNSDLNDSSNTEGNDSASNESFESDYTSDSGSWGDGGGYDDFGGGGDFFDGGGDW